MKEGLDKVGREGMIPKGFIVVSSAFATRHNARGVRRYSFLALDARWRHVSDAGKGSIRLWRFNVCLDNAAEIDDDVASHGPASSTITACFDGNGETVFLTEDDGSGRMVSEAGARVPNLQLTG